MLNADKVIKIMKKFTGIKYDSELAKRLKRGKSAVSIWRSRQKVPMNIIKYFCDTEGISLKEFDDIEQINKISEKSLKYNSDIQAVMELIARIRSNPKKIQRLRGYLENISEEN